MRLVAYALVVHTKAFLATAVIAAASIGCAAPANALSDQQHKFVTDAAQHGGPSMDRLITPAVKEDWMSPNDDQFITAITGDGISMDQDAAIREGHAVCMFLAGGSMWNAIAQIRRMHPDWSVPTATRFVERSIQHYCPAQAPL